MSGKNKRKFVSMITKLNAIKRLDAGETIKSVATDLGVGEVTVGDWRRNRIKIEQFCSQKCNETPGEKRKSMRTSDYEKTSKALFLWFTQQRSKGTPISGPILQEKAVFFRNQFKEGEEDFSASVGWLDRWKKRYGVRQLNICGEILSADTSAVQAFQKRIEDIILTEKLTPDQLYNCDETGLNFKMLPSKSLASKDENSAPGHKKRKERLTILACANASGNHKMKLTVIGKSAKPRSLKNITKEALPVHYTNQKSAWMNREIFKQWFLEHFVPETRKALRKKNLPCKAILFLDNAPSHPDDDELRCGEIRAIFFPANVTSLIQPMDQGVLENLKKKYRRRLLQHLVQSDDESVADVLRNVSLRDVVYWIADSWEEVQPTTVIKSWTKFVPELVTPIEKINDDDSETIVLKDLVKELPGCENSNAVDLNEWLNSDDKLEITDSSIIEMMEDEEEYETEENDSPLSEKKYLIVKVLQP